MKAIIHHAYGPPQEVLHLQEVETPRIGHDEVLVEVHAAAVAGRDSHLVRGEPYAARLVTGLRKPKHRVPGTDVAGRVVAVGSGVDRFTVGEDVFGWCHGAFAEHVRVPASNLEVKPVNLTFAQAAVVPVAGSTALRAVRDAGRVRPHQQVLVIGASGGVGTIAVQIAAALGATVTGVCSTTNTDLVRSIGAHRVVDYTMEDFGEHIERYDVVIDLVGNRSLTDLRRTVKPDGTVVLVDGGAGRWIRGTSHVATARLMSPFVRQRLASVVRGERRSDLAALKRLIEVRLLTPVVSAHFSLAEVPQAMGHFASGHARGNVAITL